MVTGNKKLILESDSELVVDLLSPDMVKIDANYVLITKVREVLKLAWDIYVKIQHAHII